MYNGECGILIKDIKAGLKNINVIFIVLEIGTATVTKENREVRNFKVGDHTACINVSIWDEPGKLIAPGDIIKLTKGYASIWRHCLTLYSGKNGEVNKIGEFCMTFNEAINMSEPKRPEPLQQQQQALGMAVVNSQMPSVNVGVGGTVGAGVVVGGTPPALQIPPGGGNGVVGGNTTAGQRIGAGGVQAVGVSGNTTKTTNLQQVSAAGAQKSQLAIGTPVSAGAGTGNTTAQQASSASSTPQAIKPSRGGRSNVTRASNLKGDRR